MSPSPGTCRLGHPQGPPHRGLQGEAGPPAPPTQRTWARSQRDVHVGRHLGRDTSRHPGARAEDTAPRRQSHVCEGNLGDALFLSLGHCYSVVCQTIKEINRTLVLNAIQPKLRLNRTRDCLGVGRLRRRSSREGRRDIWHIENRPTPWFSVTQHTNLITRFWSFTGYLY